MSSQKKIQSVRAEDSGSAAPSGRREKRPIDQSGEAGLDEAAGSTPPSTTARGSEEVNNQADFDFYGGEYAGKSLRDGVPNPPHHWEILGVDGVSHGIQMPLRALGSDRIAEWRKNAGIPDSVSLRPVKAGEDPTRLPNYLACVHPVLFSWGLRLPLPRYLAHFCAYLGVPIGQLSANCLWVLTCLHVLWRASGCEYPTPAEVLQLYAPRIGHRKGHQGVVELRERAKEGIVRRSLLKGKPTSETTFRDSCIIADKGWRYTRPDGIRPFAAYGRWAPLKKSKFPKLSSYA